MPDRYFLCYLNFMKNERNSKDRVKKKLIVENCIENKNI